MSYSGRDCGPFVPLRHLTADAVGDLHFHFAHALPGVRETQEGGVVQIAGVQPSEFGVLVVGA